jgi:hypothetical protein
MVAMVMPSDMATTFLWLPLLAGLVTGAALAMLRRRS